MIGSPLRRAARDLALHPWPQLFTLASVTLVSFLAGLFLLFLHNLDRELLRDRGQVQFQVYWKKAVPLDDVRRDWEDLKTDPALAGMTTFEPDQALDALADSLGKGTDLAWLKGRNPLPATALLTYGPGEGDREGFAEARLERLKAMPGVERVSFSPLQADLAKTWSRLSRVVLWPLVAFLALVAGLIVCITVRLSRLDRAEETEILRLVGASAAYIRLPMLIEGMATGLAGGLLSLGLLKGAQHMLKDILHFPPIWINIDFLPPEQAALLVAVLAAVGLLGSWAAVRD